MFANQKRTLWKTILGVVCALGMVAVAQADTTIDFQLAGAAGGSISFSGTTLNGANIPIRLAVGNNTPLNNGQSLWITNGYLNFTTGNVVGPPVGSVLTFSGAGSFSIVGTIATLGLTNANLLSGSFLGATFDMAYGVASLFLSTGTDTKNPALIAYYFGNQSPIWSFSGMIGAGAVLNQYNTNGSFRTTPSSVDILNTVVPEPASILLFGTALFGVAVVMRRKLAKSSRP